MAIYTQKSRNLENIPPIQAALTLRGRATKHIAGAWQ